MAVRIGGQAVIEGVMMKNMDRYAVSVRKPNGKIETKVEECVSFAEKHPLFQLPVFRGMANFLESMVIGMKTLNYSASFYEDEEEQTESRTEQLLEKILGEKAEKIIMGIVLVFSLAISIGLFMILPYIASEALGKLIRNEYVILFMEGIIRIAIFLGYIVIPVSMACLTFTAADANRSSLISFAHSLIRSLIFTTCGEVKEAVFFPCWVRSASKNAQTDPFPFVPATWIICSSF